MAASAHASHRMIEWLDGAESELVRVGGKAASLNRLARAGFRIPPGFCLTTDAFSAQAATLAGSDAVRSDPTVLLDEATRRALVEAMTGGPLSPAVAEALVSPLRRLTGAVLGDAGRPPLLAVRSSGVAEDGAAASFAGLHDTELGLTADEVAPAVLRCWASLWSDRAIGYRVRRGLALDGGAMAVVVQALVPAQAAAVAFTRHPVTGRSDHLLINAVRGLGEAMVSGTVTPDNIVIDKGGPLRRRVHARRLGRRPRPRQRRPRPSRRTLSRGRGGVRRARRYRGRARPRRLVSPPGPTDHDSLRCARDRQRDRLPGRVARAVRRRVELGMGRHAHAGGPDAPLR